MTPPDARQKEAVVDPSTGTLPVTAPAAPVAAAPRRAVSLAAPTAEELAAAREIAASTVRPRLAASAAAAARTRRPCIESKLAGAADSEEMLRVMNVEVALYRARRLSGAGDKQREMFRVLSVFLFIGLVVAVIGAMWYLRALKDGHAKLGQSPAAAAGR